MTDEHPSRESSCTGKIAHNTQKQATYAAARYEQDQNLAKHAMTAYKCRYCRKWHIGHTSLEVRMKKLRRYRGGVA